MKKPKNHKDKFCGKCLKSTRLIICGKCKCFTQKR